MSENIPRVTWVERMFDRLSGEDKDLISSIDYSDALSRFPGVSPIVFEGLRGVHSTRNRLRNWEILMEVMESDWSPYDWYMVFEYHNDLDIRSGIQELIDRVGVNLSGALESIVDPVDRRFCRVTVHDGGAELKRQGIRFRGDYWWYFRCPRVIPWSD
ncbi:hypothetical protein [Actinopolyspora lacussalsi]|uniref:hypothetical protein n=1 Tax=Actinopolyspora righensis TaxID=995060 RepID=UPI00111334EF|nr:hypothetical protein [Actinopolyspora righensis]